MQEIKKIVIIGPESTGKSTICTLLARSIIRCGAPNMRATIYCNMARNIHLIPWLILVKDNWA